MDTPEAIWSWHSAKQRKRSGGFWGFPLHGDLSQECTKLSRAEMEPSLGRFELVFKDWHGGTPVPGSMKDAPA